MKLFNATTAARMVADGLIMGAIGVAITPLDSAHHYVGLWGADGVTVQKISESFEVPKETRFQALLRKWNDETKFISDPYKACANSAFREIVDMKWAAVPLIMDELAHSPNIFLLSALEEITGEDPISPEDYGDVEKMVASWLNWANEHREGETINLG